MGARRVPASNSLRCGLEVPVNCSCARPIPGNRHPETCRSCAKTIPPNPLPDSLVSDFFDHLRETLIAAGKVYRPQPGEPEDPRFAWFEARCKERLLKGAETYGNRNFLKDSVDLIEEGTQECLDGVNYVLMEMTKTQPDATAAVPLGMAALHYFQAALDLQDYAAKLRGSF